MAGSISTSSKLVIKNLSRESVTLFCVKWKLPSNNLIKIIGLASGYICLSHGHSPSAATDTSTNSAKFNVTGKELAKKESTVIHMRGQCMYRLYVFRGTHDFGTLEDALSSDVPYFSKSFSCSSFVTKKCFKIFDRHFPSVKKIELYEHDGGEENERSDDGSDIDDDESDNNDDHDLRKSGWRQLLDSVPTKHTYADDYISASLRLFFLFLRFLMTFMRKFLSLFPILFTTFTLSVSSLDDVHSSSIVTNSHRNSSIFEYGRELKSYTYLGRPPDNDSGAY